MTDPHRTSDPTRQFVLRLPPELLAQVDRRAKDKNLSRNQWFEYMTRWVLGHTTTVEQSAAKQIRR
jgi:predicted HicB family RNase H-like nuclease